MAENIKDDNIYLYLDFGGNLKDDIFEEPINLQIANLHKENPLVQLNERVFKGKGEILPIFLFENLF